VAANVLIVTDVRLYRESLERVLGDESRVKVVGAISNQDEVLSAIGACKANIVLIDLAMQESLQLIGHIDASAPSVKIVALGVAEVDSEIIACAEAGVSGYITREGSLGELVQCVEAAARGEPFCSPKVAASLLGRVKDLASQPCDRGSLERLTKRETQVLQLIDQGLSNKEIARGLSIEVSTVKNHIHSILDKLKVRRRGQATAWMHHQHDLNDQKMRVRRE
jgi:DNA-binding NarL/FixJ family response regulator